MRLLVLAFTALLLSPALAAPTCQNKDGDAIRCGTPGAMPVGWALPPAQFLERQTLKQKDSDQNGFLKAVCLIGLLLAIIALMPEFDGTRAKDWGSQEGDEE
jgi:hypothetical protein